MSWNQGSLWYSATEPTGKPTSPIRFAYASEYGDYNAFYFIMSDGKHLHCSNCGSDVCTQAVMYPEGKFYCSIKCEEAGENVTIIDVEMRLAKRGGF